MCNSYILIDDVVRSFGWK